MLELHLLSYQTLQFFSSPALLHTQKQSKRLFTETVRVKCLYEGSITRTRVGLSFTLFTLTH